MLVFTLVLIAGGLLTLVAIVVFICDFVVPLLCGVVAGHIALATGGGWPAAMALGALTFAVVAAALRLSTALARPLAIRLICAGLIVVPAAGVSFLLTEAILWNLVESDLWRTGLAIMAAFWIATDGYRRHMVSGATA